jgi:hypothetical protein
MKRSLFCLWMTPLFLYVMYFCIKLTVSLFKIWSPLGWGAIGILIAVSVFLIILLFLIEHPLIQVLWAIIVLVGSTAPIAIFIGAHSNTAQLFFIADLYTLIGAVFVFIDGVKKEKWQTYKQAFQATLEKKPHALKLLFILFCVSGIVCPVLIVNLSNPGDTQTFQITDQQAQSYDLVVYFPDYTKVDTQICSIFQEVNATLSFPMSEDQFSPSDNRSILAANAVALLNTYNVKVEIWPLFEREYGSYPSISEMGRWEILYFKFHNWTVFHNLTVDYVLWDIESGGEGANKDEFNSWVEPYKSCGRFGAGLELVHNISQIWNNALETINTLGVQAKIDGHIMRTTTHTIIWDLFDGDSDIQKHDGLPVWDATASFEYISMMAYLGCEWGGNPGTSDSIYEVVRASKLTQPGTIAVCLGCINYTPYPTITPVVNDVLLSIAAGCDSVRLFQANSWINGVGTWEGRSGIVNGGIAHGVDGVSGLRQLLLACRKGGSVSYVPTKNMRNHIFNMVALDVLLDLSRPF